MRKTVVAALLLAALPAAALAADDHMAVQPNALKWGPPPPGLPAGAQVAVVSGNPGSDGPYVVRARLPAGYKIPPHTHPTDENVTVLSGTSISQWATSSTRRKARPCGPEDSSTPKKPCSTMAGRPAPRSFRSMAWARLRSTMSTRPMIRGTAPRRRRRSRRAQTHTHHRHGRAKGAKRLFAPEVPAIHVLLAAARKQQEARRGCAGPARA